MDVFMLIDAYDSAVDAVYVHTSNPNRDNHPALFNGASWDVHPPVILREFLTDPGWPLGRFYGDPAQYVVRPAARRGGRRMILAQALRTSTDPGSRMRSIIPLIAVLAACGPRAVPEPPEPVTEPARADRSAARLEVRRGPPPPPPPPPPRTPACRCIRICVVQNGQLVHVDALYNTVRGEMMTMDSLPFSSAAPLTGDYASVAGWYVNGEPIPFRGRRYTRHGLPRVLAVDEVVRVGVHGGVPVFAAAGDTAAHPVLYLPVRQGCEFQPYQPVKGR